MLGGVSSMYCSHDDYYSNDRKLKDIHFIQSIAVTAISVESIPKLDFVAF